MKKRVVVTIAVFCFLTFMSSIAFAVPPMPARIGGTVTVDSTQLTEATDTGYTFKVTKQNGSSYNPTAEDTDGLNTSDLFIIDIPIYDATDQPGGAHTGETAKIHVYKNGNELQVTSPSNGLITVGDTGSNNTVNITATTAPPVTTSLPVPTMTEWGMIMFMVLAGVGSIYYLSRKSRKNY